MIDRHVDGASRLSAGTCRDLETGATLAHSPALHHEPDLGYKHELIKSLQARRTGVRVKDLLQSKT